MTTQTPDELNDLPLSDLFRSEVEVQAAAMTEGLLALERDPSATEHLKELMYHVFTHRAEAKMKGEIAARTIPAISAWDKVLDSFMLKVSESGKKGAAAYSAWKATPPPSVTENHYQEALFAW